MENTAMAYAADKSDIFQAVRNTSIAPRARARQAVGFLRHLRDAISSWSARSDDAEIAALLERTSGRFTDSVEREMLQHRSHSSWTAFY